MGIHNNALVTLDGLLFFIDLDSRKSLIGAPITNLLSNKVFTTGWVYTNASYNSANTKLVSDGTNGGHHVYLDSSVVNGTTYTQSYVAKRAERNILQIAPSSGFSQFTTGQKYVNYDLSSGRMYGTGVSSASMIPLDDGWFRCSYTDTADTTGTGRFALAIATGQNDTRLPSFVGSSTQGILIKEPQLENAPFSSPFVNTSRANTGNIIDVIGGNVVTANSLTYNSNATCVFNGTSNYITFPSLGTLSNYSIELVVKMNSLSSERRLFSQSGVGTFTVRYSGTDFDFHYNPFDGSPPSTTTSATGLTYNTSSYYHLVATNSTTNGARFYVNGTLRGTGERAVNLSGTNYVGCDQTQILFSNAFIPVVRVYNKEMTEGEIDRNFSAVRGRYGM